MSDFQNETALATSQRSIGKLTAALAKAQSELKNADKDSVNPHFKAKYADLAAVFSACREALAKNELAVMQPVSSDGSKVFVKTILSHSSGEYIEETLALNPANNTPQAFGSAISYGRRYSLASMLGIAADDDDGNAATGLPEKAADKTAKPPAKKPEGDTKKPSTASQKPADPPSAPAENPDKDFDTLRTYLWKEAGCTGKEEINLLFDEASGGTTKTTWEKVEADHTLAKKVYDHMTKWVSEQKTAFASEIKEHGSLCKMVKKSREVA